jgi:hypothetical protein
MARRDITGAVDFDYLENFVAGDAALVAEVLDLFCEQAALWGRLLDPEGDAGAWRDGAHTLKGSSLGVGARPLAEVCGEAEAGWQSPAAVKAALKDRLDYALDMAMADIAAYRHERLLQDLK